MTREAALVERTPEEALSDWDHEAWRASVGDDLLGGYAQLVHPPRGEDNPYSVWMPEDCIRSPWELERSHRLYQLNKDLRLSPWGEL